MAERGGGIGGADVSIYRQPEQPGMMDVAGKAMGLAQQNTNLQQTQFNLQQGKLSALNGVLSSLIADPDVQAGGPKAMARIMQESGRLVSMGIVSAKDLTAAVSTINPENPIQQLRQTQLQLLPATERMNAVYGNPMVMNNGQTQQVVRQSPFMGGVSPMAGGTVQNQPTPDTLLGRVTGPPDATGAPTQRSVLATGVAEGTVTPQGQIATTQPPNPLMQRAQTPANRLPIRQPPVAGPAVAPPPTGNPAPDVSASSLPIPKQPARGVQQPGAVAQNNPYGATVTALPPGQPEAMRATGEASGTQLAADMAHASKITQATYPVIQALTRLEKLGPTGTGPGTEQLNQIKSFAQSLGLPGFDSEKIKNYDEAKKFLTDYVNRMNPASDARLLAAVSGNPSTSISNAAAVDLSKSVVALERMRAAQAKAFQATGLPENQYARWGAQWNAAQDPRAYAIDVMGPEKFNKLRKELEANPAAYNRFKQSYAVAKQNGLVTLPTQQQGQ